MRKKVFDEISTRTMAFMTSPRTLLLEKCAVGSGKTWNTVKSLTDNQYQWIYLAPFHTVIDENLKMSTLRNYEYIHLKSRAKLCEIENYQRLAERGVNIRPICESSCPLKDTTCPYYSLKRQLFAEPQNWAGVHHHLKGFLTDFFSMWIDGWPMKYFYDVLVLDENPISVLFENEMTNGEQIGRIRDIIELLRIDHKDNDKIITFLETLMTSFMGSKLLDYDNLFEQFTSINFRGFYEVYQERLIEELIANRLRLRDVPKDYLTTFSIMKKGMSRDNIESMIVKKMPSPYTQKKYHFMGFDNSALLDCPIKIIGLDGTANVKIWESITGRRASILERRYVYKNIYQLKGQGLARYPLSSWVRQGKITTSGLNLCRLIDGICIKKRNRVLVACTKPLQPHIFSNTTSRKIDFCNYYYVRSRNEFFEKCDTIILASEPNIQQFQLECFSNLSGWEPVVWRQVFTQEEMIQTVGRIREDIDKTQIGRIREPREIFIFPFTPSDEDDKSRPIYNEARIIDYSDLLQYVATGVLPEETKRLEEETAWDMIVDYDLTKIYRKTLMDQLGYKYNQAKDVLTRLVGKGLLNYDGKGFRRND